MTDPKSIPYELHEGYEIRYRPWLRYRPWRVQIPNPDGRNLWGDVVSLQAARDLIDRSLLLMSRER